MSPSPADLTTPATPLTGGPRPVRHITIGLAAALAIALAACLSVLAFVVLHRAPLPEESVLLAASTLTDPWHATSPLKSSL